MKNLIVILFAALILVSVVTGKEKPTAVKNIEARSTMIGKLTKADAG